MRNIREKDIERQILDYLSYIPNCFVWKCNTVGVYDEQKGVFRMPRSRYIIRGVSDILGLIKKGDKTIPLAIEVKRPRGTLSESQKRFLDRFKTLGGMSIVAYSVEDVRKALEAI